MGMLDLQSDSNRCLDFLQTYDGELSDDIKALQRILKQWGSDEALDVGESGTLYRFVQYLCWLNGSTQQIKTRGTLRARKLTDNPAIIDYSIEQLLKLDGGTSQWASAAVLFTDINMPDRSYPYHLQMSLNAKQYYAECGGLWEPRCDATIQRQATAFFNWRTSGDMIFTPVQSEDFPFAVAFGVMTTVEGEQRWPQLRNHETDRVVEMGRLLNSETIDSPDHRVVQALALRYPDRVLTSRSKKAVTKSWPQFWLFHSSASSRSTKQ